MPEKKQIAIVFYPVFSLLELVRAAHVSIRATMMSGCETSDASSSTDLFPSNTPLKMKSQKNFNEVQLTAAPQQTAIFDQ